MSEKQLITESDTGIESDVHKNGVREGGGKYLF